MYDIAQQVKEWLAAGREVEVATVVAARGLSSRRPAPAAAWAAGEAAIGELVAGVVPENLERGLVEIAISDADARAAGLACGGSASVLVQPASAYPAQVWEQLLARDPLCLVTAVSGGDLGATDVFTPASIRESYAFGDEVSRLFGRGVTSAVVLERAVAIALWPIPTLVVMGDGLIADALRNTAQLLGWDVQVTPEVQAAVAAVRGLKRSDAVVVLSHDRSGDGPTLAAALAGPAGYVGALGSRHTQIARLEWLTEHGVPAEAQARIHGPAGLDIGAHTPAEIAVSIVAEIIANRATASGGALRARRGPVHEAGVQSPPPRY
ncbi:MAG TPA: XdhC family protein [Jatrophihabitans sp.]|nr:XdhC family protein [Jatrophihabitans sp.]